MGQLRVGFKRFIVAVNADKPHLWKADIIQAEFHHE